MRRSTDARRGAINASTVFAVTLAIIAGLIFAWVFKTVFLTPKRPPVAPVEPTYRVTVMAIGVSDNTRIGPLQVKRVSVTKAKYDEYKAVEKTKGPLLVGNQPINRVTKETLTAEEPVYESQLKELKYPRPVSEMLEPGKVASIVEVPARNTMVQVDDRVDVMCTLTNSNPAIGPTETRTAVMAKNVRVVARFNSTRDAAQPSPGATRPYTLEVTPYRYGLIELAKSLGGLFALRIHDRSESGAVSASASEEEEDPVVDRVTTDDLVKLFGFSAPLPQKYFEVEAFNGVVQTPGRHIYQQPGQSSQPAVPGGGLRSPAPGGARPGAVPGGVPSTGLRSAGTLGGAAGATTLASATASSSTGWQRVSVPTGNGMGRTGALAARGGTNVASLQRGGVGLNGVGSGQRNNGLSGPVAGGPGCGGRG